MENRIVHHLGKIQVLLALAIYLFFAATSASADDWRIGNIVGLCRGTQIRQGPGYNYAVHTTVPENDWAVKIIGGPRSANGEEWWDTSRKAAGDPSGGTGWVSKRQATACKAAPPTQPPPTQPSPARIVLVSGLVLSRSQAVPGEWVNASFRVKNIGGQTFRARYFGIKGRGPGDSDYSFHWVENFTLAPGQEFGYDANRTFERIGSHWFTPNYSVDGSTWTDVKWQDGRTSYVTIQIVLPAPPTTLPPPPTTRRPPTTIAPPTTLPPPPRATTPAPVTLDYICGYSTAGMIQSGFLLPAGTFYPYIVVCSTGEKIGWGPRGGWGQRSYVQINDPVIVALAPPVHLNDGTIISREISRWSDYIQISSCADCGRYNEPPITVPLPTTPALRPTTPAPTTPAPQPTTPPPKPTTPIVPPTLAPHPGELRMVSELRLSNTSPRVGENVTAEFTIRNVGGSPVTIRRMVAGARGPNARNAPNDGWSAPNVDFDAVTDLVLRPNETYSYRAVRSFSALGEYFVEPAWLTPSGEWEGIKPYQRVWFTVKDVPTITPVPPQPVLQVRFPLGREGRDPTREGFDRWYPFGGHTGVTSTSGICLGGKPINRLIHAGEDWGGANWNGIAHAEVYAIADGTLAENALTDWSPGRALLIHHESLGVWAMYGHLSDSRTHPLVVRNRGDTVKRGQVIGYVYNDGDNSHLHFEMRTRHPLNLSCVSGSPENTWGYGYVRDTNELGNSGYTDPSALIQARLGIKMTARVALQQTAGTVAQGEKKTAGAVAIAANQARVDFAMRWPGSTLDLVVVDPQGRQVDERYSGAQWLREATRLVLTVQQPLPGDWSMSVIGKEVSMPEEPYEIIVSAMVERSTSAPMSSAGIVILLFALMLLVFGGGATWIIIGTQSSAATAPVLCVVQGNQARPALRLTRAQSFIGRDRRNALVLTDPSVSAQHARITRHTNGYAIYDLGSKNGILVNGKRVTQHLLRDGDRIKIGLQEMIYKQTIPPHTRKG